MELNRFHINDINTFIKSERITLQFSIEYDNINNEYIYTLNEEQNPFFWNLFLINRLDRYKSHNINFTEYELITFLETTPKRKVHFNFDGYLISIPKLFKNVEIEIRSKYENILNPFCIQTQYLTFIILWSLFYYILKISIVYW